MRMPLMVAALLAPVCAAAQPLVTSHPSLSAMAEEDRQLVLQAGIVAARLPCTDIAYSVFSGTDAASRSYWDVRCHDGNRYRATLSRDPLTAPVFLPCGAAAPGFHGGPCFRPVDESAIAGTAPRPSRGVVGGSAQYSFALPLEVDARSPAPREPLAVASAGTIADVAGLGVGRSSSQSNIARQSNMIGFTSRIEASCHARCDARHPNNVSACIALCIQGSDADAPPFVSTETRYGAIYSTAPPFGAVGFANGSADRLAVNIAGARGCADRAGRQPCLFQRELVNQCGAVAQAIMRHPRAMVITSDVNTYIATIFTTGVGDNLAAAEADALAACRAQGNAPGRRDASGPACRITASGC